MSDRDGQPEPRHRKNGRARKRNRGLPGRHLRVVADLSVVQDRTPVPPGAYPVANLAGMSSSATEMLLHRARIEAESGVEQVDHLVVTRDVETGVVTYNGPFSTGLEALETAHDFVEKYRGPSPHWDVTITVAPVTP